MKYTFTSNISLILKLTKLNALHLLNFAGQLVACNGRLVQLEISSSNVFVIIEVSGY